MGQLSKHWQSIKLAIQAKDNQVKALSGQLSAVHPIDVEDSMAIKEMEQYVTALSAQPTTTSAPAPTPIPE